MLLAAKSGSFFLAAVTFLLGRSSFLVWLLALYPSLAALALLPH